MRILLLILFGAVGTLARYALEGWVQDRSGTAFPARTLVVNLLGCFLLGALGQFCLNHIFVPPDWRIGLTIGFFGAFTTFSTFGWETVHMLEDGEWMKATLCICASFLGGILFVMLGMWLGNAV